jgi:hypothetical protein
MTIVLLLLSKFLWDRLFWIQMEELIGIADFYFYTALFIYSACGRQEFGD